MKQAANFRLNQETMQLLTQLHELLKLSRTEVIERSLKQYAKMKLQRESKLLKYAGKLKENDASDLLLSLKDKTSKPLRLKY